MKSGLMLLLLLVSQLSFAQSLKDKRTKEQILERVDEIILNLNEAQDFLKKEEVDKACDSIDKVFALMPEHLMSIGTKMNIFDGTVMKMEQETKLYLIYIHQQSNTCDFGERGENINMSKVGKQLGVITKTLEKQKKKIKKLDTTYSNSYRYHYEFH